MIFVLCCERRNVRKYEFSSLFFFDFIKITDYKFENSIFFLFLNISEIYVLFYANISPDVANDMGKRIYREEIFRVISKTVIYKTICFLKLYLILD